MRSISTKVDDATFEKFERVCAHLGATRSGLLKTIIEKVTDDAVVLDGPPHALLPKGDDLQRSVHDAGAFASAAAAFAGVLIMQHDDDSLRRAMAMMDPDAADFVIRRMLKNKRRSDRHRSQTDFDGQSRDLGASS